MVERAALFHSDTRYGDSMDEKLQQIMSRKACRLCRLGTNKLASSLETLRFGLEGAVELLGSNASPDRYYDFGNKCDDPVAYERTTDSNIISVDLFRIGFANIGVERKNFCGLPNNWVRLLLSMTSYLLFYFKLLMCFVGFIVNHY